MKLTQVSHDINKSSNPANPDAQGETKADYELGNHNALDQEIHTDLNNHIVIQVKITHWYDHHQRDHESERKNIHIATKHFFK
jgi:hypothetical protein